MAYQEWGSGPPHFDGKNYQMWSKRKAVFLHGKGKILWDVEDQERPSGRWMTAPQ
jgi:hypothetical protein